MHPTRISTALPVLSLTLAFFCATAEAATCTTATGATSIAPGGELQLLLADGSSSKGWQLTGDSAVGTIETFSGRFTAIAAGTVSVTALSGAKTGSVRTLCSADITVTPSGELVKSVTITGDSDRVQWDDTWSSRRLNLGADVSPTTADDRTVTWAIQAGTGDASVNEAGIVSGTRPGTVTVTATNEASGVTASKQLTVVPILLESMTLEMAAGLGSTGEMTLDATLSPLSADDSSLTWSMESAIATVSAEGVVTWTEPGVVVVTAHANDDSGLSASVTIDPDLDGDGQTSRLIPGGTDCDEGDADVFLGASDTMVVP